MFNISINNNFSNYDDEYNERKATITILVSMIIVMFISMGMVIYLINTKDKDKETNLEKRNKLNNRLKI